MADKNTKNAGSKTTVNVDNDQLGENANDNTTKKDCSTKKARK